MIKSVHFKVLGFYSVDNPEEVKLEIHVYPLPKAQELEVAQKIVDVIQTTLKELGWDGGIVDITASKATH